MGVYRLFKKNTKNVDFKIDDTSNEKRRGLKMELKKVVFPKMGKVIFLSGSLGESIRFRERE